MSVFSSTRRTDTTAASFAPCGRGRYGDIRSACKHNRAMPFHFVFSFAAFLVLNMMHFRRISCSFTNARCSPSALTHFPSPSPPADSRARRSSLSLCLVSAAPHTRPLSRPRPVRAVSLVGRAPQAAAAAVASAPRRRVRLRETRAPFQRGDGKRSGGASPTVAAAAVGVGHLAPARTIPILRSSVCVCLVPIEIARFFVSMQHGHHAPPLVTSVFFQRFFGSLSVYNLSAARPIPACFLEIFYRFLYFPHIYTSICSYFPVHHNNFRRYELAVKTSTRIHIFFNQ
jgi:hypothetical protein